ncbi:proton-conducting transporter membrane subunit [uncultured Sphingosinicella sp.]|jgi:NAD(P)H-quinone oxidoreductase subunit 5|uniref:proton-conducting transporter transmembrane domain-containing protein n=1 Tax=uncultured Sphingosinicella sp. TaxID=478748 RepID=UPI0030DD9E97|tara:strand:+ start:3815 stop:5191 length:1377 start_codon:yes stop_codon:yes gene_type:complete
MQLLRVQLSSRQSLSVVSILWFSLVAAAAWVIAMPSLRSEFGLSFTIGLLTIFVAAIIATFSLRYMRSDSRSARFFLTLSALVASVLTLLFTNNILVLGAAWCFSGWLLAGVIGHSKSWAEAHAAARRTRATFFLGDTALLAALALLGWHAGSLQLDGVLASAVTLPASVKSVVALLLVVTAATRCAQPPFVGWLLSSMTAPTPVSALMHAGLVNAGGFLLIRFAPLLEAAPFARTVAVVVGLCGAIYGIGIMMVRPDVKRSLAGSTVSQMGFMIMSCGLGAYAAALWHIIAHGLFKAWLFLGSGSMIGMKTGRGETPLSGRMTLGIATGTVGVAICILSFGEGDASLVPLLLAMATAFTTLIASLEGKAQVRAKLLLLLVALIAFHSVGVLLAGLVIDKDASPLVPEWVHLVLLVVFLGAWTWQQQRFSTGRGLPMRLYVHLINAGALPATGNGEEK